MENCGLVLEGGGMRGLYTAGVLEFFLEKDIFFKYVIGVSAGACMAASYLAKQKGRNKKVNIGLVNNYRYLSYRNLLFKRELFGMDFLFDEVPNKVIPFDFKTFLSSEETFLIGTTDCKSGEPIYYNKHQYKEDILKIIRASSSVPFISRPVDLNGKKLLDGGIVDPIPIKRAEQDGNLKNIIIMTKRDNPFKKNNKIFYALKLLYRKYPEIASLLEKRHYIYEETLEYIDHQEKKGNIFLFEPSQDIDVSPIEKNQNKLTFLYELGYKDAKQNYENLLAWLNTIEK